MRLSKAWIVASKDFKILRRRKSIAYAMVGFEMFVAVGLPLLIQYLSLRHGGIPTPVLVRLLDGLAFWFAIGAMILPMGIASYSLIGEKVQRSLEPLLATPTTDAEILLGKGMAALVPTLIATYIGAVVFMILMDIFTYPALGYFYFPNWRMAIILLLLAPLASVLCIEIYVLISSRVTDIRTAQQLAMLLLTPFGTVYSLTEAGIIVMTGTNLLSISAVTFAIDIVLYRFTAAAFQREEILTRWR
jgi:ABC-2 type transport system permease protein